MPVNAQMQFPVYLHLFGFRLHPHLIFESLAYTIGFAIFRRFRKVFGDPVPESIRWSVIAAAVAGAAAGSKVLYWLEDPVSVMAHWRNIQVWLGGKSIVGGLAGGLLAVEWVKYRLKFQSRTGDLFAVPLCAGIAVGRIGCFLTGLDDATFGNATSLPWGVDFGDGIRRHPTQLYEIIFAMALSAILRWMQRAYTPGDIFKGFITGYCGWRLVIDFLKPDPAFFGLNSIQWACVAILIYYSRDIRRWMSAQNQETILLQSVGEE
jgi:prolipoprotein diacylglyceryltransferase